MKPTEQTRATKAAPAKTLARMVDVPAGGVVEPDPIDASALKSDGDL